jgi:hypothetical protein
MDEIPLGLERAEARLDVTLSDTCCLYMLCCTDSSVRFPFRILFAVTDRDRLCIIAAGMWLHLSIETVKFDRIYEETGAKYGREITPGYINESILREDVSMLYALSRCTFLA